MQRYKLLNFFNLFGIFSIFFFVAFLATYFYSPVFKTSASESDTVSIGAEIEDVVSVALSSHELNFEFTPTPEGVFDSKYVDVSVKTNTFGGYELYFSSIDNETDMVHDTVVSGDTNPITDVISSDFSGTVTGTNMESNKWGYSLDTTSPILDKEYSIIPTLNNRLTLANTSSSTPGTTETKRVYIGVKVNSTLKSGTYAKTLKFTGVAHESPTCTDCTILNLAENESKGFDYSGNEEKVLLQNPGYYKLEAWGAEGGDTHYDTTHNTAGGYGGYSVGITSTERNSFLFINVGGAGTYNGGSTASGAKGGYNGGGNGGCHGKANNIYTASGGGATHIALTSGLLSSLEPQKGTLIDSSYYVSDKILIVAGGGGAGFLHPNFSSVANSYGYGGNGGGIQGNSGYTYGTGTYGNRYSVGTGGTQTAGGTHSKTTNYFNVPDGSFGQGPSGYCVATDTSADYSSGGGGGWYGGGVGSYGGTGGGSGYIASSNLISGGGITKHMTCYSCTTSTVDATRTNSNTTTPSDTAIADVAKLGNGYARITYLGRNLD